MTALRIAGALFLAWLGLVSMYRAVKHVDGGLTMLSAATNDATTSLQRGSLRQGLTVNLLSPAVATFYLAVVPSFLSAGSSRWYFPALAATHILMALACHSAWAIGLHTLRRFFQPPLTRRILGAATGVALVGLAMRVVTRTA
jgi:threonine/homoserine/homoserine lactone efflux protein